MTDEIQPERDLPVGLPVYTQDGKHIGTVREVFGQAFKVDASLHPDYWLSTEAIASTDNGRYTLAIDENRLHDYRVRNPHEPAPDENVPGGIEGRAGVYPNATAAAGLLIPDERPGSDPQ